MWHTKRWSLTLAVSVVGCWCPCWMAFLSVPWWGNLLLFHDPQAQGKPKESSAWNCISVSHCLTNDAQHLKMPITLIQKDILTTNCPQGAMHHSIYLCDSAGHRERPMGKPKGSYLEYTETNYFWLSGSVWLRIRLTCFNSLLWLLLPRLPASLPTSKINSIRINMLMVKFISHLHIWQAFVWWLVLLLYFSSHTQLYLSLRSHFICRYRFDGF